MQDAENSCRSVLLALLLIPLSAGLTKAYAAEWVITRISGTVYLLAPGIQAHRARKGMALHKGHTIATRKGARAVLQRGNDSITVGPNTEFALSQYRSNDSQTTLLQRKGTIDVDVETRGRPFFRVETPYLAAVVKGTRFSVTVTGNESQVSVQRGVVGVQDLASGQQSDLRAGQSVQNAPGKFNGLKSVGKSRAAIQQGTPGKPSFGDTPASLSPAGSKARNITTGGRDNAASGSGNANASSGNSGNRGSSGNANENSSGNSGGNSGANSGGNSGTNSSGNSGGNAGSGSGNSGSAGASNSGGASAGASAGNGGANANAAGAGASAGR
ncbi:FecR domain-containing protein [Labrenzia sp. 5N]|uniref:FecR family protein n=1 Tax=Labrenzia sp. 5N TaxID=2723402 RepID=UPI0014477A6E|nr:FecR family protein [Labrenzia sp. 5N]NKX67292.1 FecR domain-containing protein [Labrenzia sp. 5N]